MALMDEFKEERALIKNAPFKEKLKYFWCYYKWHTIVCILIVAFIISLVHDITTHKDTAFFVTMLNSMQMKEESTFAQDYADYADIDLNQHEILVDTTLNIQEGATDEMSMSSSQRMMVYTAAGELDVIIGGSDIFPDYANGEMFFDLREFFNEEQLAEYEPYFYYVDRPVVEALMAAQEDPEYVQNPTPFDFPDPSKPEEMEDPVPVGLFVTDCKKLSDEYFFEGEYSAMGIMGNGQHHEATLKFIEFIFGK